MSTFCTRVIKVEQPIAPIYIAKINSSDLLSMSVVDRRHIVDDDEVLGIQRELKLDKVRQIKKYLSTYEATFPNSIIVNVKKEDLISVDENEIMLRKKEDTFTIIDGQHRLAGFEGYTGPLFELIVTIFIDLRIDQQAEIFSTINSQQTKVDPSLNVSLVLSDPLFTPKKMIVEIAQSFNFDKESPWYNNIKKTSGNNDGNDGLITLSAFSKPLFDLTFPESDWYLIKNALSVNPQKPNFDFDANYKMERYPFWFFYKNRDSASVYKILWNYFKVLQSLLEDDWLNQESLLNKTTGYNAMIHLFKDLVPLCINERSFNYSFILQLLDPLKALNGSITSSNYGTSGTYASNQLFRAFWEAIEPSLKKNSTNG